MADGRPLVYGSICSGIEAATVAWHPLGWRPAWFAEIDKFPSAVLAHHYPEVPNFGDFTKINREQSGPIDVLVGGTPCQSFSVAGKRAGLDDPRGDLTIEWLRLVQRLVPRWLVWENVPGVLSIDEGRTFGTILGTLGQLGYGFAYRVLDAQYFGVPQRRRRVFVVGHLGDWRRAAAVLFERHSLSGHPPARREAGAPVAALTSTRVGTCGADDNQGQAGHLIAHTLRAEGFNAGEDGTGCGIPLVSHAVNAKGGSARSDGESETFIPVAFHARQDPDSGPVTHLLDTDGHSIAVAFNLRGREGGAQAEADELASLRAASGGSSRSYVATVTPTLRSGGNSTGGDRPPGTDVDTCETLIAFDETQITSAANRSNPQPGDPCHPLAAGARPPSIAGSAVRRLTPRECERLEGFPDDYTLVPYRGKPAADGPRYKALGNSMAVPVMRFIGQRIQQVEQITEGDTRHDG